MFGGLAEGGSVDRHGFCDSVGPGETGVIDRGSRASRPSTQLEGLLVRQKGDFSFPLFLDRG